MVRVNIVKEAARSLFGRDKRKEKTARLINAN